MAKPMTIFHAHLETGYFDFDAYGRTAEEAAKLIEAGWNKHHRQYQTDYGKATLRTDEDINDCTFYYLQCQFGDRLDFGMNEVRLGSVWRDRDQELLFKKETK